MKLTSILFEAYLQCPTKCYLRSTGQTGTGNAYADWVRQQNDAYQKSGIEALLPAAGDACAATTTGAANLRTATWRLAVDLPLERETMASRPHAIERVPPQGRGQPTQFIPVRFVFLNKLTKDDRLLIAFDALVLSDVLGRKVNMGKIIHGDDHATLKVKVASLQTTVRKLIGKAQGVLSAGSAPDLILNRHCGECEFRDGCHQSAVEKEDLSLLAGMSDKERKKCHEEGIFTVSQLSYTFRPRRRPKRLRDKRERYHHSLKAMAIREKKIHIVGSPELKIEGTPVYFDVEGLPDRDFYYLIGLRVGNGESAVQHSFWADTVKDEAKIFREFLAILESIEKPVLIHYGSYERTFLKTMVERYGGLPDGSVAANAINASVNLISAIFAQVYVPTYSNSLKDIGMWLGFKWSRENASGIQSIVWRMKWQQASDCLCKDDLITYNAEDCHALHVLADVLVRLCSPDVRPNLENGTEPTAVLAESPTSRDTLWRRFKTPVADFEIINKAARWDSQRDKVFVRVGTKLKRARLRAPKTDIRVTRVNKDVWLTPMKVCPFCATNLQRHGSWQRIIYDIRFSRFGVRRWVVRYRFPYCECPQCNKFFGLPDELVRWGMFGRNVAMFVVYQTVDLCLPLRSCFQHLNRLFGFGLQDAHVHRLKARAAEYCNAMRESILARMLRGGSIHADETPVVLKHKRAYVWVFATSDAVVYFYSETREGSFMQEKLKGFHGVIISDFYSAYDALSCPQQKCLIHLIRDLNDAVLDYPFDEELKSMVTGFGELLRTIIGTIDRRGLKARFLRKHLADVRQFYRRLEKPAYQSEAAKKWKERFVKNRNALFTFLSHDGVPWNNNNAEHAIKAFARLRRAIVGLSTAKGIDEYLVLLSICQTCKYAGVDFLDFLLSGEKDVHAFAESRGRRKSNTSSNAVSPDGASDAER
jgi:predicted RecB family nuclease